MSAAWTASPIFDLPHLGCRVHQGENCFAGAANLSASVLGWLAPRCVWTPCWVADLHCTGYSHLDLCVFTQETNSVTSHESDLEPPAGFSFRYLILLILVVFKSSTFNLISIFKTCDHVDNFLPVPTSLRLRSGSRRQWLTSTFLNLSWPAHEWGCEIDYFEFAKPPLTSDSTSSRGGTETGLVTLLLSRQE